MKKITLLFILFICINKVDAQKISYGLKAGMNISDFTGEGAGNNSSAIVGFHGGFFTNIRFSFIALQPEILVSAAGAKFTGTELPEDLKIVYLSIPLMMQIGKQTGIYAETGPQLSIRLNEKISNTPLNNFIERVDFSLGIGIGFRTKTGFGIGGRYVLGISNAGSYGDLIAFNFKNSVFQIGLSLNLKRK